MTTEKFTEGKWHLDFNDFHFIVDKNDSIIAEVFWPPDRKEETTKANARLIAAAPEMYELLKEELIPTSDYGGIISFERERKIKELLARIDGEEKE